MANDRETVPVTQAELDLIAWNWLDGMIAALCDEEPSDLTYSADQMVDAFIAGARHRLAATEELRAENERLREAGRYLLRAWDQVASEDEDILLAVPDGSKVFSIASAGKALEGTTND